MQRRICAVSWNRAVASFDTTYHHKLKSWNLSCSLKYKVLTFTSLSPYSLINATTSLPPPLSPSPPSLSHTHNILLNELLMLSVKLWIKLFTMLFVAPALAFYTLWLQSQHSCLMFSFTAPTSERWCVLHSFGIIITACLPLSSTVCTCEQQNSWLLLSIFLEQNMRSMCYTCMRYLVRVGGGETGRVIRMDMTRDNGSTCISDWFCFGPRRRAASALTVSRTPQSWVVTIRSRLSIWT